MQIPDEYRSKWPIVVIIALVCVAGAGFALVVAERGRSRELAAANRSQEASLAQMRSELQAVRQTLSSTLEAKTEPAPAPVRIHPTSKPRLTAMARTARKPAPEDPRWNQIRAELASQQKELASTREDLGKTREELKGELGSTRDELSTSIAKNHDELVVLQKRGERNYHEFQLNKAKEFQKVGSLSLSLRKANVKRKSFNMAMMIDDNELQKKDVNLYEPVWINVGGEQLQLVVNQISKDQIRGYLSEPKYKRAEVGESAPTAAKTLRDRPPL
jgi:hypothetical protein